MSKIAQGNIIKEVLMCRPLHFSISYTINPWMKIGSENKTVAQVQWQKLYQTYLDLGIRVNLIDQQPNSPDMVFGADQGIIQGRKVLMSNFRFKERKRERKPYLEWFLNNGYKPQFIPEKAYFEGSGECLFFGQKMFIGIGFRADKSTCKYIKKALGVEVIPLELVNPYFYHLDTALFILNEKVVFYYPQAFSKKSQKVLRKLVPDLIAFNDFEANNFAANSVVTDHQVIINKTLPEFRNTLAQLGYKAIEVDISEFAKAGGGAHCLTNVLKVEKSKDEFRN